MTTLATLLILLSVSAAHAVEWVPVKASPEHLLQIAATATELYGLAPGSAVYRRAGDRWERLPLPEKPLMKQIAAAFNGYLYATDGLQVYETTDQRQWRVVREIPREIQLAGALRPIYFAREVHAIHVTPAGEIYAGVPSVENLTSGDTHVLQLLEGQWQYVASADGRARSFGPLEAPYVVRTVCQSRYETIPGPLPAKTWQQIVRALTGEYYVVGWDGKVAQYIPPEPGKFSDGKNDRFVPVTGLDGMPTCSLAIGLSGRIHALECAEGEYKK